MPEDPEARRLKRPPSATRSQHSSMPKNSSRGAEKPLKRKRVAALEVGKAVIAAIGSRLGRRTASRSWTIGAGSGEKRV